jgi:hypothetical protein
MAKQSKFEGDIEVRTYDSKEEADKALDQMRDSGYRELQEDNKIIIDHDDREHLREHDKD